MNSLSIITVNAYPSATHVNLMLRNLAAQTFTDFDVVLMDRYYFANRDWVAETCKDLRLRVTHTPACEDRHVGRTTHWELYNNALVLAQSDWVVYYGVFRYLHRQAIEAAVQRASKGICTVFHQMHTDEIIHTWPFEDIETVFKMDVRAQRTDGLHHSGFFAIKREWAVDWLNGYNDALLIHHWADVDSGARARHCSFTVDIMPQALIRIANRPSMPHYAMDQHPDFGKPVCRESDNPHCIAHEINRLRSVRRIEYPVKRIEFKGFEWAVCDICGTLGAEDDAAYIRHLMADKSLVRAPVNLHGVGRNLSILAEDLKGQTLSERVSVVAASHTNLRYLTE